MLSKWAQIGYIAYNLFVLSKIKKETNSYFFWHDASFVINNQVCFYPKK